MRLPDFWAGAVAVRDRVDLSGLAARAGGWESLERGGPELWRDLGVSAEHVARWQRAPPIHTIHPVVTAADPRYPPLLAGVEFAPPVLFVEGDPAVLSMPQVAIVGTRTCTRYGEGVARHLAHALSRVGWGIVSGMARGIDAHAHRGALPRPTVAVLAHGLAHTAPQSHRELRRRIVASGAVVSAWPDDVEPRPWTFPRRNRWIAALASHTVFVEGSVRSGAMHTVSTALALGREVHAVPGPLGAPMSAGPNKLLGAQRCVAALCDVEGFVAALGASPEPRDRWLRALFEGASLDRVARMRGGGLASLLVELGQLEATGRVVRLPGQRYAPGG